MAQAVSGESGEFVLNLPGVSSVVLVVDREGFERSRTSCAPAGHDAEPLDVTLSLTQERSSITVTGTRGSVEDPATSANVIHVVPVGELNSSPLTTLGTAVHNLPGVMVQTTTHGHVSPFLRGMTGYQTLILLDGLRFNTSLFRSGPNQYLSFIDPSLASSMETVLGPNSAAYGSDALGGTLSVLSPSPRLTPDPGWQIHGQTSAMVASADASGMLGANVSVSNQRVWLFGSLAGRRLNDLRAGGGDDSRNVFRRYFGLDFAQIQDLLGQRLQDTGFRQASGSLKMAVRLGGSQYLTALYQKSSIDGLRSYRDGLGGLGRLQALFVPQAGEFLYARYEALSLGRLDSISGTLSMNQQDDGSLREALKFTDPVTFDNTGVRAFGYSAQAAGHVGRNNAFVAGGEYFHERIYANSSSTDLLTQTVKVVRPIVPNGTSYLPAAVFAQDSMELFRGRLRLLGGVRFTSVSMQTRADENLDPQGKPLGVADSRVSFHDWTFNGSVSYRIHPALQWFFVAGQGFRAPSTTDLGSVGLSGLGYEVPVAGTLAQGAILADSASEGAVPAGRPIRPLGPEQLTSYETGISVRVSRLTARVQGYYNMFTDPIVRRTLLFPQSSPPASVEGVAVTPLAQTAAQKATGVVGVVTAVDSRAVKTYVNDGDARFYGTEVTGRWDGGSRWWLEGYLGYLNARTLNPNRPIRRLPPIQAGLTLRTFLWKRLWVETAVLGADSQYRLNSGDYDDERIGASRTRNDIANFFKGGLVAPLLGTGSGGTTFAPTGETLRQIQDRVLPLGSSINGVSIVNDATRVPLLMGTSGWVTVDVRGGVPIAERWTVVFGALNLMDRNYRVHGSGVDAPGFSAYAGVRFAF